MITLSLWDIFKFLLLAARWTLLLSGIAFLGGGMGALLLLLLRYARPGLGAKFVWLYTELLQGTPTPRRSAQARSSPRIWSSE